MIENFTNNISVYNPVIDCGRMITDISSKANMNLKIVSIAMLLLIIFEWWAINRVNNGRLTHDEKQKYISFIMVFIHSLILFGAFYFMYWILLSGLEF